MTRVPLETDVPDRRKPNAKRRKKDLRRWVDTLAEAMPPGPQGQPPHKAGTELHVVQVAMTKVTPADPSSATAELKISATPTRAVVFVDDQFAGHADEFDGVGKAMLLIPGEHHIRISLPGYQTFETSVTLRARQKLKIKTELMKGSITEAGPLVSAN